MGNNITNWHAELHKKKNEAGNLRCTIFNEKEQIVADIEATEINHLIDEMRRTISANVKREYGDHAGHELSQSKQIGEEMYDIPITITDMSKPVINSLPHSSELNYKETPYKNTDVPAENTNVYFTSVAPSRVGYYFYSEDGTQESLKIVFVKRVEEDEEISYFIVLDHYSVSYNTIEVYDTEEALWSKNPIPLPDIIDANQEKPVVDHEDW